MRNLEKYSAKGRNKITESNTRYDLTVKELDYLYNKIVQNMDKMSDNIFEVITMAYYSGIESGYRLREKEQSSI